MTDIATVWNVQYAHGDWAINGADLLSGDDLATAVYISLFTDRLAEASDVLPDNIGDRRGWWGDAYDEYPIGSRLWLLSRSVLSQVIANKAIDYATEALQWLIGDQVAASVAVTAAITLPKMLALTVVISMANGTTRTLKYNWAWNQIAA
jgi:phage gp46-like protein